MERLSISLFLDYEHQFFKFLRKKGMAGLPNLPSMDPEEILRGKKHSWEKQFFSSISDFELMIFGLLVKKFGRFSKTALCVSRGDVRMKKSFNLKSFFSISFWIWADDFQDSGEKCSKHHQSCILPVQTNILPKNVLEKKNSTLEDFQGKNLEISAEKCLQKNSEGTKFAKKGNSNHLLTSGEKVSNFSPKIPSRAVRTAF